MNPAPEHPRRRIAFDVAAVLLLAGLAVWLRWSGLFTEGFHNEDAAGITYNADLLRAGGLPYKDDLEWKAPGAFYLVAMIWGVLGRSIAVLQQFMCGWSILAAVGVYVGGAALYDRRAGLVAALLYTVFSPITDSIDINYGAWMIAPYVWCTTFAILALKRGTLRWWIACGATLAFAGLLKRQAAVIFPLFALLVALWPRLHRPDGWRGPAHRIHALGAFAGGLALGFAPLMIWSAAHGGLGEFVRHYFFSESGWRYVAKVELDWSDKLPRIGDGFLGFWAYMAVPAVLAAFTLAATLADGEARKPGVRGVLLGGHFWLSFLGAALGFRFFKGYYLQVLPAAVWLAAHPRGPITRWFRAGVWQRGNRLRAGLQLLCLLLALVPAAIGDIGELQDIRRRRATPRDADAARVGEVIRANSAPGDRIWVWGRWAWPVYFHADRLAPGRFYKVLGVLTNNLTNTWRRPTEKTEFTLDSPWEEVTAELVEGRPAFIAVSRNEGYRDWKAFRDLLRTDYDRVRGVRSGGIVLYRRKDHPWTDPPAAERPKPTRRAAPRVKPGPKPLDAAPKVAPPKPLDAAPRVAPPAPVPTPPIEPAPR